MYDITYNNIKSSDIGVEIVQRPDIPTPERNIEEQTIPGRDGLLFYDYKTYKALNIPIKLNFKSTPDSWHEKLAVIKSWLLGGGELYLSDMEGYYYKVNYVKLGECERTSKWVGTITATFICEPFAYSKEGATEVSNPVMLINSGHTSEPTFVISGQGVCTLTVNDNIMQANIEESLTIDTHLQKAYLTTSGKMKNASVKGEYEGLKLMPGENTISVTEGFDLKVTPHWRRL